MNKTEIEIMRKEIQDDIKLNQHTLPEKSQKKNESISHIFEVLKKLTETLKEYRIQYPEADKVREKFYLHNCARNDYYEKAYTDRNNKKFIVECYDLLENYEFMPEQIINESNLSDSQLTYLFNKLQENGYISKDTPIYVCVWIFGCNERPFALCEDFIELYRTEIEKSDWDFRQFSNILYLYISDNLSYTYFDNSYLKKGYCLQEEVLSKRIRWIKNSTRDHKQLSKKSLLDLLYQLGVNIWNRKEYFSNVFIDNNNKPLKYNSQNYKEFEATDYKSEYHNEIAQYINDARNSCL